MQDGRKSYGADVVRARPLEVFASALINAKAEAPKLSSAVPSVIQAGSETVIGIKAKDQTNRI
jgi:hypothetical protein